MVLSEIQSLPTPEKLLWLSSPDGIAQLREWLSMGYSMRKIAAALNLHCATLRMWCKQDVELAEIITCHQSNQQQADYTAPPAYRLILEYSSKCKHGKILATYETAEDVWQSHTIQLYFGSYGLSAPDYIDNYIAKINQCGIYRLSTMYCIAYCTVDRQGIIRVLIPPK